MPFLIALAVLFLTLRVYRQFNSRSKTAASSSVPVSPRSQSPEKSEKLDAPAGKSTTSPAVSTKTKNTDKPASTTVAAKPTTGPKRVQGRKPVKTIGGRRVSAEDKENGPRVSFIQPVVFFASLTTTTERYANLLLEDLRLAAEKQSASEDRKRGILPPQIHDISYLDFDDFFTSVPEITADSPDVPGTRYVYCILVPTYNIDTVLNTFLGHLDETHNDFRIDTAPLSKLGGYSVFGFGDKEEWPTEEEGFCSQAKEVDRWMAKLTGRKRVFPLGMGDVKNDPEGALKEWTTGLLDIFGDIVEHGGLGEGVPGSGDAMESDEEDMEDDEESQKKKSSSMVDLEDIKMNGDSNSDSSAAPIPVDFTTVGKSVTTNDTAKEMVPKTSPTYAALTKQGYSIVGSHSGVKICRWTKSALRGRGSCYKYSFYGIRSHLCMEATPSLSCSNKCIFCWRHGTNPVGTTWRWKVDEPELIFNGVKEGHYKKIKMLRGVPGVRAERFAEAMRIRHCALSLVGEPIFYPHINRFLEMLHNERISSFLVCNAQHPDQLEALHRVTQLYVSIDASNRESLRKIDRPLHRDFWERFQRCLDILREKRSYQRTVFRLTLVNGFNVDDEVQGYANLVEKALPGLVEIKGVTFCGTSTSAGAGLTMKNVPFYEEVAAFCVALNAELERRGLKYGIAAEHAHSCCVLIASERFRVNDKWHTRIDYQRFFELLEKEKADGTPFTPEDYMAETEEWAYFGNGGFNPDDERWYRKNRKPRPIDVAPESAPSS